MIKLVLLRHGQSEWNLKNLFTGWTDVELSDNGVKEAHQAGKALKANGYSFDVAFSSVLKRANHTMDYALEEMGETNIPKFYSWRLNERHYGALQGLNKAESAKKWGDEQVHIWRRSADVPPLALTKDDERWPGNQEKYKELIAKEGFEPKYGARPLKRAIQNKIEDAMAEEILEGRIHAGDKVSVGLNKEKIRFTVQREK